MAKAILVALDFEEPSKKAFDLAKKLAPAMGAEIVLVHVYQLPVYTYPGFEPAVLPGFHLEVTNAAKRALDDFAMANGSLRSILREGDPAVEILAAIAAEKPALVALGTHGRRGIAHLLLGSVAEKVVRQSSVPVLTVRA